MSRLIISRRLRIYDRCPVALRSHTINERWEAKVEFGKPQHWYKVVMYIQYIAHWTRIIFENRIHGRAGKFILILFDILRYPATENRVLLSRMPALYEAISCFADTEMKCNMYFYTIFISLLLFILCWVFCFAVLFGVSRYSPFSLTPAFVIFRSSNVNSTGIPNL